MDNKDKLILAQQVQIGSLRYTKSLMQKQIEDQSEEIKNYRKAIAICLVFAVISITISIVRIFS